MKNFWKNEDGIATVEWVVLIAAGAAIVLTLVTFLAPGIMTLAEKNSNVLEIEE